MIPAVPSIDTALKALISSGPIELAHGCVGSLFYSRDVQERSTVAPATSYHLLFADDDDGFREVLRSIFEPYFTVVEAASGEEALDIMKHVRVDLLVLDMNMDELTGLQTIRIVKKLDSHLPCILVTADATDELRQEALEADAWSVLAKPVQKRELLTTVSTAIGSAYGDSSVLSQPVRWS